MAGTFRVYSFSKPGLVNFCLLRQPVRTRFVPDPGTLEQRLFRAVTTPVLPPVQISPAEKRIRREEEFRLRHENNRYRKFLRERAREDFYEAANGRMMLILFPLFHKPRELVPIHNQLFQKNLIFRGFPTSILREAAVGTRWETFSEHVLKGSSANMYILGDADPNLCRTALTILRKAPFLLLLGGVVQHRILTADQVKEFADFATLGNLEGARANLAGVLEQVRGQKLVQNLTAHQTDLVASLRQYSTSDQIPS